MFPPRLAIGLAVSLMLAARRGAQDETDAFPEELTELSLEALLLELPSLVHVTWRP